MGHFSGYFEGASTFLTLKIVPSAARDNLGVKKVLAPHEISLEMAHYVVCPQKKIISRIFKISGASIVTAATREFTSTSHCKISLRCVGLLEDVRETNFEYIITSPSMPEDARNVEQNRH